MRHSSVSFSVELAIIWSLIPSHLPRSSCRSPLEIFGPIPGVVVCCPRGSHLPVARPGVPAPKEKARRMPGPLVVSSADGCLVGAGQPLEVGGEPGHVEVCGHGGRTSRDFQGHVSLLYFRILQEFQDVGFVSYIGPHKF